MLTITENCIELMMTEEKTENVLRIRPVVQLFNLKQIRSKSDGKPPRYRAILSDGKHWATALMATQLSELILSNQIKENDLFEIEGYTRSPIQGRTVIVLLKLGTIMPYERTIGEPQEFKVEENMNMNNISHQQSMALQQQPMMMQQQQQKSSYQQSYQQTSNVHQSMNQPSNTIAPYVPQQPGISKSSTSSYAPAPYVSSNQMNVPRSDPYRAATADNNPYKPQNASYNNPQSTFNNRGPIAKLPDNTRITEIKSLNPYISGKWTIKAKVTSRGPVKTWSNARGEGSLFSIDLVDSQGGEIRGTFFKEAVEKFYSLLHENSVYYFSGGKIKMANRKFSAINNDYEVTFDLSTEIIPANDDTTQYQTHYSFKTLNELEVIPADSIVDIIGVVIQVDGITEFTSKTGKQLQKKDIVLVDESMVQVKVTLWNEKAIEEGSNAWLYQVLAIKGAKLSEYNGRSISTFSSTKFEVNPVLKEAGRLRTWYSSNPDRVLQARSLSSAGGGGSGMVSEDIVDRMFIDDIKTKNLGYQQAPDYVTAKAYISFMKSDQKAWYQACPKCQKKVIQSLNGQYGCEKCQQSFPSCENRYVLSVCIADCTGSTWVTCFNDQGKMVIGKSANELEELKDTNPRLYEKCYKDNLFKEYIFRLRIKAEQINEEMRVRVGVVSMQEISYIEESRNLINVIEKYL